LDKAKNIKLYGNEANKLLVQWVNPNGFYDNLTIYCSALDDVVRLNVSFEAWKVNVSKVITRKNATDAIFTDVIAGLDYKCMIITNDNFDSVVTDFSSVFISK
jgi:hypothetical protein